MPARNNRRSLFITGFIALAVSLVTLAWRLGYGTDVHPEELIAMNDLEVDSVQHVVTKADRRNNEWVELVFAGDKRKFYIEGHEYKCVDLAALLTEIKPGDIVSIRTNGKAPGKRAVTIHSLEKDQESYWTLECRNRKARETNTTSMVVAFTVCITCLFFASKREKPVLFGRTMEPALVIIGAAIIALLVAIFVISR